MSMDDACPVHRFELDVSSGQEGGDWAEEKARELCPKRLDDMEWLMPETLAAALREAEERGEKRGWHDALAGKFYAAVAARARRDAFREAALEVERHPWWVSSVLSDAPMPRPANVFAQEVARRLRAKAEEETTCD